MRWWWLALLAGCGATGTSPWTWELPPGFPVPRVPADNPMTVEKVALGKALFFDTRLSFNRTQSCGTCHQPELAFTDGRAQAVGSTGAAHRRNAQSLLNVAYATTLTWANPLVGSLESQALLPLFGDSPVELGWAGRDEELVLRLSEDEALVDAFELAFPDEGPSLHTLTLALAAFERTLISGNAPYDRFVAGDELAMSEDAKSGMALFNSERLECYHCHTGFTFSDSVTHANSGQALERPFHNTGLYDLDGQGSYPLVDTGLYEITARIGDMGKFRAPSLRNLRLTAPYMHDGSMATLGEVIDAYAAGGRAHGSPLKSELVRGFTLSATERRQLEAFLEALTDGEG